jgi:hypothetical protein
MNSLSRNSPDARRVVLGAAVGLDISQVRTFIQSLRASGYGGDIVMLVGPLQFALKSYLSSRGVQPLPAWYIRRIHGPIFTYRFELLAEYLNRHADRYDQVLISDVRDVVFQRHPFEGITNPACHFFLESADWTIGSEPTNMRWMQMFLAPDQIARIRNCQITCCGVSLGGIGGMTRYLNCMAKYLHAVPLKIRRRHGADTVFHNLMAHLTRDVDCVMIENNGHVATMGLEPASAYVVGADRLIRTAGGGLPAILHQYDRIPEFRDAVEARYSAEWSTEN